MGKHDSGETKKENPDKNALDHVPKHGKEGYPVGKIREPNAGKRGEKDHR